MIKVENLTKRYAGQTAIQDLNFEVSPGEIMGFLGPNGAGKTTTMRILAGFMPPTSGRASIAGFDVFGQSLQARAHLGYMPENVPLYSDMRVTEYLNYRAALKGVPHRRIAERVGDVKELCGLKDVERKLIGTLSKGYRQRVGLADALVAEPGQAAHDFAFHPYLARGGNDMQPRNHYSQRENRSMRYTGKLVGHNQTSRRRRA
jgi:ABC-2 type transport system ATP-binding protein